MKKYKTTFFRAEQFVEKPHFDQALEYVNSGQYRWNAGMFVWSFVTITEGLQKHQPEMYAACQRWFKVANKPAKLAKILAKDYPGLKKTSIDYALMEHAQNVIVADGAFEWDDIGSWTALARHLKADAEGNCVVADFVNVDGARNIIYDARTKNRARRLPWLVCAIPFLFRPMTRCCWRTRVRRKKSGSWSGNLARTRS